MKLCSLFLLQLLLVPVFCLANPGLDAELIKVKRGDNLAGLLKRAQVEQPVQNAILIDRASKKEVRRFIRPGETLELFFLPGSKNLTQIHFEKDYETDIQIQYEDKKWVYLEIKREFEQQVRYFSGVITKENNSLYLVAKDAEIPLGDDIIDQMAEILGWQIDFTSEVRVGDHFQMFYTELYFKGRKLRDGHIRAVEFTNFARSESQKRVITAVAFRQNNKRDYFDLKGKSVQKAFLRYPLKFSRISGRFSRRFHPVLKRWRSHKGIDFAAARGTPVFAAGDGRIIERKYSRSYGNVITIAHSQNIRTRYAHLNNFSKYAKGGAYLRKGTVIGYVGTTGLSTGPHLHYEWIKNGRQANPLRARIPNAMSVADNLKKEFECTKNYWSELFTSPVKSLVLILKKEPQACLSEEI